MVALSRNVPRKMAMEMLLMGEFLHATRVAETGQAARLFRAEQTVVHTLHGKSDGHAQADGVHAPAR